MNIETEVAQFIVTTFAPDLTVESLPFDQNLLDTGIVDSLRLLRLISWVGERFDILITDGEITPTNFSSVETITAFVERHVALPALK